jgi:collagenase-like PrtC family protease
VQVQADFHGDHGMRSLVVPEELSTESIEVTRQQRTTERAATGHGAQLQTRKLSFHG